MVFLHGKNLITTRRALERALHDIQTSIYTEHEPEDIEYLEQEKADIERLLKRFE